MKYLSQLRNRVRRPNIGTVLGVLALAVALGGTAVALPGSNTVTSGDIRNGAVRSADIRNERVRANDLAADSVGSSELGADSVGSSELAADSVGSSELGADSVGSSELVTSSVGSDDLDATTTIGTGQVISGGTSNTATANCPVGAQVIAVGFTWDLDAAGLYTTHAMIHPASNNVTVRGFNDTGGNRTLTAYALCIAQ